LWRNLAIAAVLGPPGACIGALLRNQVVTVAGVVIVALADEPQLLTQIPEVGRFGPLFAAPQGIIGSDDMEGLLAPGAAIAVALAGAGRAGAALRRRRGGQRRGDVRALRGRRSAAARAVATARVSGALRGA
jgi:hypothetical protein